MKSYILSIVFILTLASLTFAQPGQLDKSFGQEGKIIIGGSGTDQANCILIDNNNKILFGGETSDFSFAGSNTQFVIYRLNEDGSFDQSFGGYDHMGYKGRAIVQAAYNGGSVEAIALQDDGKILAAGWMREPANCKTMIVVRLNSDGTLDKSFGTGGIVKFICFGDQYYKFQVKAVMIQSDKKIVLAGRMDAYPESFLILYKLNEDGSLVNGFGSEYGYQMIWDIYTHSIKMKADNSIVIGGAFKNEGAIMYVTEDGSLDQDIGNNGVVYTNLPEVLDMDEMNNSLVAGWSYISDGTVTGIEMTRFNKGGNLDPEFGSGGVVYHPVFINGTPPYLTYINHDIERHKFILAGYAFNGIAKKCNGLTGPCIDLNSPTQTPDFYILRLNEDGSLDDSFGEQGSVFIPISTTKADKANAGVVDKQGRILMAGYVHNGTETFWDIAIVRVLQEDVNTSVDVAKNDLYFTVYPNPGNDIFKVNADVSGDAIVTVVDPLGRIVRKAAFSEASEINLSDEPAGMYIIEISGREKSGKRLIVKQ